ncbi:MAG: EVE domain-containing protein [Candidatus Aureabacteria bacterium]|jgi:predicted RNA-binding protein|nr:EVE domain-containing protein [Candidatus Auribacterota bacterium]
MQYWLVVTSPDNFRCDREQLGFELQGLPYRFRKQVQKMALGDKVVYYIMKLHKFGAIATVTGEYFEDSSKKWTDKKERWPSRRPSKPDIVLQDDELIDAKKLVPDFSFIRNKEAWGTYFQGSIKTIPEDDFKLIESEMKKVIARRSESKIIESRLEPTGKRTASAYEKAIMSLPLQANTLHDRLGEMLEQIGTWMEYNTQTRHRIVPDHAYELDVAWLSGKNPEVAIEIQVSGNLTEAKDRLAQARKFNYRKVILVLRESDLERLNRLLKHEPDLRSWMDAWSIGAIYDMYKAGETFFKYYRTLREAIYKDKKELEIVK